MDLAEKENYKRLKTEGRKYMKMVYKIQHWMKYAAIPHTPYHPYCWYRSRLPGFTTDDPE